MFQQIIKHSLLFLFWSFLQVLVINNWDLLNGWMLPQPYIFFILALPFEIPLALLLLFCMAGGLFIDSFTNTPGMNASALLLIGVFRSWILKAIAPRDGYEFGVSASVKSLGIAWFVKYVLILGAIHHFWLFVLEFFSWQFTLRILVSILLSLIGTLIIGLIFQFFRAGSLNKR
ncbi:MAG: hypothetical protein ACJAY8_000562 [Sphingobacteriales bacterium]|jgi:hypothetical protein